MNDDDLQPDIQSRLRQRYLAELTRDSARSERLILASIPRDPSQRARRPGALQIGRAAAVTVVVAVVVTLTVGVSISTRLPAQVGGPPLASVAALPSDDPAIPSSPTATVESRTTAAPSPAATSTPPPIPGVAPSAPSTVASGFARVITGDTPVYGETELDSEPIALLDEERQVYVSQEPVEVDGNVWYRVEFDNFMSGVGEYMFGWLPAQTAAGRPALRPDPPAECVALPIILDQLAGLEPTEALHCYGASEIRLRGTVLRHRLATEPGYAVSPAWLSIEQDHLLAGKLGSAIYSGRLDFNIHPSLDIEPPFGALVEVVGHFDDPVASTCRREPRSGFQPSLPGEDELWCRQRFVVTELRIIEE